MEILEEMVRVAREGDRDTFDILNSTFNEYDRIRQSLLMAFQYPQMREEAISDAELRLNQLNRTELRVYVGE